MKKFLLKAFMLLCLILWGGVSSAWADSTGTITFGTNDVRINAASVTGDDDLDNTWTITTVGTTSFTANAAYYQVGSSSKPATSITFTTTLPESSKIKSMSAKFGGFSGTAGTVTLKVGETSVGTGSLDATNDVTVSSTSSATGTVLTVTLTDIAKGVKVYNISYTIENDTPVGPTDASWSVSPAEIAVKTGKSASATVTTNYDGELIAETNDANVATCSFKDGVLTVTGVSAGTTTITFLGEETSKYNEIEKEVTVTVTDPAVFDPSNFVIGDFVEDIPAAVDGNISFNLGDYSFEVKKNNGGTAPTVHGTALDMRIYAKGSITISSATKQFDGVVFNISEQGLKRLAPITADCGTVETQTKGDNTVTWSSATPVSSVTFTVGDDATYGSENTKAGQLDFVSMSINEVAAPTTATITINPACTDGEYCYTTYSNSSAFVTNGDIIVYEVFVQDDQVTLWAYEDDAVVPANTGVLIAALEGRDYEVELSNEAGESVLKTSNALRATGAGITAEQMATADAGKEYFRLTMHNGTDCGFWWGAENGAAFDLGANKAYLVADPAATSARGFSFGDNSEALESIEMNAATTIYTLNGVKVNELQKGLNIVNGKKVMVK